MFRIIKIILLLSLIWISSYYGSRQLNLPLIWWLAALAVLVIQISSIKVKNRLNLESKC
jgi:hypothetical protein